jgi:hypothetical protein
MEITELIKPETLCPDNQPLEADNPPTPLPDNGLVYERDYIGIASKLLNDTLILCFDKQKLKLVKEKHPGIPIYFPAEIEELYPYKDDKELIRWVHTCKKKFGAWVVPRANQTFRFTDMEAKNEE